MTEILVPGAVELDQLSRIWDQKRAVQLAPESWTAIERSAGRLARAARSEQAIYGVNTGFGKLAHIRIDAEDCADLQRNLVRSHAAAVGDPLDVSIVRLVMILKLIGLARGASGVRRVLVEQLLGMLAADLFPRIPEKGSVGASGDLAPLAHMSLVMIGEGEAFYQGKLISGSDGLRAAGLAPITLGAKEGLALINGTQVSTALALSALFTTMRLLRQSIITGAMSTDAMMGSATPFRAEIHHYRGHPGQIDVAHALEALLAGSDIRASHAENDPRVQDPYSIRCQPQVAGACLDLIRQAARTLEIEANAVTDNPLVLDDGEVVSGGNFHAEPVAFAADMIALAISELGALAERRLALLVDPVFNYGLPAFLSANPGVESGIMAAEISAAALMAENKHIAVPTSIDSVPTSANQEDHVSMACHGARRLHRMTENLSAIIAIEAIAAAQALEARAPLVTSPRLAAVVARLRARISPLDHDRVLSHDIEVARSMILSGELIAAAGDTALPGWRR